MGRPPLVKGVPPTDVPTVMGSKQGWSCHLDLLLEYLHALRNPVGDNKALCPDC